MRCVRPTGLSKLYLICIPSAVGGARDHDPEIRCLRGCRAQSAREISDPELRGRISGMLVAYATAPIPTPPVAPVPPRPTTFSHQIDNARHPNLQHGGPGKMAFAHASTTTEASKRTIMAANKRSSSSVRNMEVPLAELTKPESHTAGWSGFGRKTPRLCRCRRTGAFWRVSTAGVVSLPIATGEPAMIAVAAAELDGKHKG